MTCLGTTANWSAKLRASVGQLALDVDLLGRGAPIALVGPNGGGKSSLLRLLTGAPLHGPQEVRFQLGKRLLQCTRTGVNVPIEERRIGYLPQNGGLFPHLTVLDNVQFAASTSRRASLDASPGAARRRAQQLLDDLACSDLAQRLPRRLSGGEAQRVALARALFLNPDILLLDEPLAALDAKSRRAVRAYLRGHLHETKTPCLLVTHDPRDVLALDADVWVLEQGRLVQQGSLGALQARPATDFVAEFTEGLDLRANPNSCSVDPAK